AESRDAHAWSWSVAGGDAHAGRTETSLMCAIDASVVRFDRAASGRTEPLADLLDDLRARGVRAVAPNGVLGDPRGASCDEGEMMLEGLVAALVDRLAEVADATGRPGGQPV
ncbi:MAG: creatininase family protein, partial [Actinobacteria bacterium]|nr:creatininase family protein [Actinomycetota bacterium]